MSLGITHLCCCGVYMMQRAEIVYVWECSFGAWGLLELIAWYVNIKHEHWHLLDLHYLDLTEVNVLP